MHDSHFDPVEIVLTAFFISVDRCRQDNINEFTHLSSHRNKEKIIDQLEGYVREKRQSSSIFI